MTLADAISRFLLACRLRKLSEHTQRAYACDLGFFRRWSGHTPLADALTADAVEAWRRHLDDRQFAATTIKRRLAALRAMAKWLEREGHLADNPFRRLELGIKLPRRLPRNLSQRDLRLLLQGVRTATGARPFDGWLLRFAVELLLTTGIRIGEACAIRLGDLDLEGRTIRIVGKGSRERQVFLIDDQLLRLTRRYLKARAAVTGPATGPATDRLLTTSRGAPASPDYIRRKLHEAVRGSGIDGKVTPHMLRHTAATQYLECGVDMRFVQRLLGHSSIATTEIYTHVSDTALRSAVLGAGVRKRMGRGG